MKRFTTFDGARLAFEEYGKGRPVVLLHGFAATSAGNWVDSGVVGALVAAGRRAVTLDARGHGASDKPHDPGAYSGDAMVRDAQALLDHLGITGAGSVDVVGYSMGSMTAAGLAAVDARVRRVVLGGMGGSLIGVGGDDSQTAAGRAAIADALAAEDSATGVTGGVAAGGVAAGGVAAGGEAATGVTAAGGVAAASGAAAAGEAAGGVAAAGVATGRAAAVGVAAGGAAATGVATGRAAAAGRRFRHFAETTGADRLALAAIQRSDLNRRPDVSRIAVPVLVLMGSADRQVGSPHDLAAAIPGAAVRIVGGSHLSAVNHRDFALALVGFLGDGSAPAGAGEG